MKHGTSQIAAAAWIACLAPSCTGADVTLATLPAKTEAGATLEASTGSESGASVDGGTEVDGGSEVDGGDGGTEVDGGTPFFCHVTADCLSGSYCDKTSCQPNSSGTCQLFPVDCPNDENPVCGCDGITYFDDCLRQYHAVAASSPGQCRLENAKTCGGTASKTCPDSAICNLLGPPTCSADAEGSCWVLPATQCSPADQNAWDSCLPGGLRCVDTCTALRQGGSFTRSLSCHGRDD